VSRSTGVLPLGQAGATHAFIEPLALRHVDRVGRLRSGAQQVRIYPDAASNQALVGTTRTFYMRVDGNKLTLKSPGVVIPTTGLTSIVQLELVKVD
jgi:hypothetical protein